MPHSAPDADTGSRRQRLPSQVRVNQILEAALAEFASHGFVATRTEDIASRAGLSKGSIYLHFKSKDELLEALLKQFLSPFPGPHATDCIPCTLEGIVEHLLACYDNLTSDTSIRIMRILTSEHNRIASGVAERWHQYLLQTQRPIIEDLLQPALQQGLIRNSVAAQEPALLFAPISQFCLQQLVFAVTPDQPLCQEQRQLYRRYLHDLLAPDS